MIIRENSVDLPRRGSIRVCLTAEMDAPGNGELQAHEALVLCQMAEDEIRSFVSVLQVKINEKVSELKKKREEKAEHQGMIEALRAVIVEEMNKRK